MNFHFYSLHLVHVLRGVLVSHVALLNVQFEIWSKVLKVVIVWQIWGEMLSAKLLSYKSANVSLS